MDETVKTYSVTYKRDSDDNVWLVNVEGMPDVHTFGRTLEETSVNTREAIAVTVDVPVSEIELEEHFDVADVDLEELTSLQDRAQEMRDIYLSRQRATALRLAETGVSRRDSARMLGISHQRVQQLVTH